MIAICTVTTRKSFKPSMPQFPQPIKGVENSTYLIGGCEYLSNEVIYTELLIKCLAHQALNKC